MLNYSLGPSARPTLWRTRTPSVIRWKALQDVGGFPEESVTEDFMMTLVLRDAGWQTAYLDEPLTERLTPEGLKEYVTQRARWCLGMIQTAPEQRDALILRFHTDGGAPGIPRAKLSAMLHGIALRLSDAQVIRIRQR
ncbi:glycosyltransferase family 2 protein [Arenibacterium sp. CAU 1754]